MNQISGGMRTTRAGITNTRLWLLGAMALAESRVSYAAGSLSEAETTITWVLNIFSPVLLLALLTILLIGCGLAVYFGKISGGLFVKILIGSILVFGARTIAPKLVALF